MDRHSTEVELKGNSRSVNSSMNVLHRAGAKSLFLRHRVVQRSGQNPAGFLVRYYHDLE